MLVRAIVAAALVGALGLGCALWARARRRRAARGARVDQPASFGESGVLPVDAELDAVFDAVLAAHAHELGDLLETRLRGLVARRVPIRAIRPAQSSRTARVCFADGTVVLVRSVGGRELSDLVVGMQGGSVVLAGFTRGERAIRLDLRSWSGRPLGLLAIGLDQPD